MVTIDSIRKPVLADLAAFDEFVRGNFNAEGELLQEDARARAFVARQGYKTGIDDALGRDQFAA